MDISILKKFLAVASHSSISGAAEALHISQPPLSRQLSALEWELGVKLLIRTNKKTVLTREGVLLEKRARQIIDLVEKTQEELQNEKHNIVGDVYIGAGESFKMTHIANTIKALKKDCPKLRYHITSGDGETLRDMLNKGLIDFALFIGAWDVSQYEYLALPISDRWGAVMPRGHQLAAKSAVTKSDLAGENLLLPRQVLLMHTLDSWFGCDAATLNITGTYNLAYNAFTFCKSGLGVVITLDKLLDEGDDGSLVFRPLNPAVDVPLRMTWKRDQVFSRAAATFLEYFKKSITCATK